MATLTRFTISSLLPSIALIALLNACDDAPRESTATQSRGIKTNEPFATQAQQAWKALESLRPPDEPAEWSAHPPTDDDRRDREKALVEFACRASDMAKSFYTRFPDHDMAPAAMGLEVQFMGPHQASVLEYRLTQLEERTRQSATDESAVVTELEKGAREMLKNFPNHFVPNQALLKVARQLEPLEARKLAAEVRDTQGLPDFVQEEAAELLKKLDFVGKPFALKFQAVDGRHVDLSTLKGKVVLIDFWATWCVPCVAELPNLRATYEKCAPRGFEIVGISLDQQKEPLTRFLEKEKITWPQFFDGQGWKNQFARELGIGSIPTMWLVDRRGALRDLNVQRSLEEKVQKLLAEPP